MRNPMIVLNSLAEVALKENCQFKRLYRNLYNEEFYYIAYKNLSSKENMISDTDSIDRMKERVDKLINEIKDESYKPYPAQGVYIPKKNGKKILLGIPSIDDKIVQEIIRSILESIYENNFSVNSHGYRPKRSCHTAIDQISKQKGTQWYIKGDIKCFFDNINHHRLIDILRKKIKDEKFINLIWKFLRAGYLEEWKYNNTYSGIPQGGIISPILSNIYLNEFDKYVDDVRLSFEEGKERTKINYSMDTEFKRLYYVRYADTFIIGVIGNKEDTKKIKENIKNFLKEKLELELSEEKTLITSSKDRAKFLGYEITVRSQEIKRVKQNDTVKKRTYGQTKVYMPKEAWITKLKEHGAVNVINKKGKEIWEPTHRTYLINNDDLEIIKTYNAEIRSLYNYYRLAMNVNSLNSYNYIMKYSFVKTMGHKYKTSIRKIFDKYTIDGKLGIKYMTKNGPEICYYYDEGFARNKTGSNWKDIEMHPSTKLKIEVCEWHEKENT